MKTPLLALATACLLAFTAIENADACARYRFPASFKISQGNGIVVTVTGIAYNGDNYTANAAAGTMRGSLSGRMAHPKNYPGAYFVEFHIRWDRLLTGRYIARYDGYGRFAEGRTHEVRRPQIEAFIAMPNIQCL